MDMTALESMSPDEIEALERALASRKEAASDPMGVLAQVVGAVLEKLESVEGRLSKVEQDFYEKVLAGIDGMYKENMRAEGMKVFGEKYGGLLGPFADDFKRVYDGDLLEKAYDYLESLKGEEGYSDEVGDGKLKELADQLRARFAKGEDKPAAVAVEVEKKVEPEKAPEAPKADEAEVEDEESDPEFLAMEKEIARMKRREESRKKG